MIILGKGTVITRDADRPIIYDGAVAIDGTQIVDIGKYDELCKAYANAEIIDAHGGWFYQCTSSYLLRSCTRLIVARSSTD